MSASGAKSRRNELSSTTGQWLPNIGNNQANFFGDLNRFLPQSTELARNIGQENLDQTLALREQVFPGLTQGTQDAARSIFPLLRGELPSGVMDAFSRAGGASTVGSGFGGSGFGFLNTGLFGARGALGAMQTGFGLLPALMSTAPKVEVPTSMDFLSSILTPMQRTSTDLAIRGQNLGVASQVAGMETSKEKWGGFMSGLGGMMTGAGLGGMGGMGGMGGAMSATGPGGYFGGGAYGPTVAYGDPSRMKGASRLFE